jgi:hypothetical protein
MCPVSLRMNKKGSPFSRPVEQHYSITKAAALVGVRRQTMSLYVKEGRVYPVRRVNHKVVCVPASSINRFLRSALSPTKILQRATKGAFANHLKKKQREKSNVKSVSSTTRARKP